MDLRKYGFGSSGPASKKKEEIVSETVLNEAVVESTPVA